MRNLYKVTFVRVAHWARLKLEHFLRDRRSSQEVMVIYMKIKNNRLHCQCLTNIPYLTNIQDGFVDFRQKIWRLYVPVEDVKLQSKLSDATIVAGYGWDGTTFFFTIPRSTLSLAILGKIVDVPRGLVNRAWVLISGRTHLVAQMLDWCGESLLFL